MTREPRRSLSAPATFFLLGATLTFLATVGAFNGQIGSRGGPPVKVTKGDVYLMYAVAVGMFAVSWVLGRRRDKAKGPTYGSGPGLDGIQFPEDKDDA